MKRYLFITLFLILFSWSIPKLNAQVSFTGTELLARPTNNSVTLNVVANTALQTYFEYDTEMGGGGDGYDYQTATVSSAANEPVVVVIDGLEADTRYYYRMVYSTNGGSTWVNRSEHSFQTQRPQGSTFTFDITSDSHVNIMLGNAAQWTQTLSNVASDHPDFLLDLGDTFAMDGVTSETGARSAYTTQRPYFGTVSHSASIFLAPGNHEQEEGWHLSDVVGPLPVWGTNARKRYFPNPVPNDFYSGNTETYYALGGDQLHEDYYAWTWGDVLFVVIDPFWYTTTKPFIGTTGGGEQNAGSGDRWDWTLGQAQFNWLKQTLENSSAKYKFIFAHHMVGGSDDYVRKGAYGAPYCEWGGYNENGTTWAFDTRRTGWYSPVHQLLVENKVSAFFHGHDHQYAYEVLDGVVYHSCASAGFTGNGFNLYSESNPYTIKVLPSSGHLRVTVSPSQTTVDYVRSGGTGGSYSYTIAPNVSTTYNLTMAVNPSEGGTTEPSVGGHTYTANTVVNISATAAAGYTFDHWSGNLSGSTNPTTITMNGNKSVTANFSLIPTTVKVAAKVFLEGPYITGTGPNEMTTALTIPTTSPYSEDSHTVDPVPTNVTDWVLVQFRSTADGAAVASKSALLHKNGSIVADDGTTNEIEMTASPGDYYIVIKHRNHLSVMSAGTVALTSGSATLYDFTSGSSQFYGTAGAKLLETDVWGLWSGEIYQDGYITTQDYTDWYNSARAGDAGYHDTDCNCDGQVTTEDYTIWYNNARIGASSQVPNP